MHNKYCYHDDVIHLIIQSSFLLLPLLLIIIIQPFQCNNYVEARSWRDEISKTTIMDDVYDYNGHAYLQRQNQLYERMAFGNNKNEDEDEDVDVGKEKQPTKTIVAKTTSPTTLSPTISPTASPTTLSPTMAPTSQPITWIPSKKPITNIPTSIPSKNPTSSKPITFEPSKAPIDPFASATIPINPEPWYFNYDITSQYGPGQLGMISQNNNIFQVGIKDNNWGNVQTPLNNYWQEFTNNGWGAWKNTFDTTIFTNNLCNIGIQQSPIDLRETDNGVCIEFHEVRSLPGDFTLHSKNDGNVQKLILSSKLRLLYRRRPCPDINDIQCKEPDPPSADFPNGWPGTADVMHIDIKIPSEHTIGGIRFDGEMQIVHLNHIKQRLPIQSVLIKVYNDNTNNNNNNSGYNYYFQPLLDSFQKVYNQNLISCTSRLFPPKKTRRQRQQRRKLMQHKSIIHEITEHGNTTKRVRNRYRSLQQPQSVLQQSQFFQAQQSSTTNIPVVSIWDPYHPMLIPTIWFWRYDGSLTEPPCSEIVTWFVADKPMIISINQFKQLQTLLLTNLDPTSCTKTSVHYNYSIARPVRLVNDRPVYHCTPANFGPDP